MLVYGSACVVPVSPCHLVMSLERLDHSAEKHTYCIATSVSAVDAVHALQAASAGKGPICDTQTFTKIEDRPVIKEVKTYVREHHPVEKEVSTIPLCAFSLACYMSTVSLHYC